MNKHIDSRWNNAQQTFHKSDEDNFDYKWLFIKTAESNKNPYISVESTDEKAAGTYNTNQFPGKRGNSLCKIVELIPKKRFSSLNRERGRLIAGTNLRQICLMADFETTEHQLYKQTSS